jgi:hypothetical protein
MPATSISSLIGCKPISASPRFRRAGRSGGKPGEQRQIGGE